MDLRATYNLTTDDGRNAAALSSVIELRRKEVGETARDACIATAINVLKTLRSDTKVAKPSAAKKSNVTVREMPSLSIGFRQVAGRRVRCIRDAAGNRIKSEVRPIRDMLRRDGSAQGKVFVVTYKSGKLHEEYYALATSADEAKKNAIASVARRIKAHSGLAKLALGMAMSKVSLKASVREAFNAKVNRWADQKTRARVNDSGLNSGTVTVDVVDMLDYALPALKAGDGAMNAAIQRACNLTVGMVNNVVQKRRGIKHKFQTPFPEVARSK